jgi:hypothetical protein
MFVPDSNGEDAVADGRRLVLPGMWVRGRAQRNLKELRPGSRGRSETRMLFIFDPDRAAIFLVAGDKAGQWSRWYEEAIPLAEARYADYRAEKDKEGGR